MTLLISELGKRVQVDAEDIRNHGAMTSAVTSGLAKADRDGAIQVLIRGPQIVWKVCRGTAAVDPSQIPIQEGQEVGVQDRAALEEA